jgi:hypothetical protein
MEATHFLTQSPRTPKEPYLLSKRGSQLTLEIGRMHTSRYPRAYARGTLDQNPKSNWSFSWPLSTFS